MKRPQISAEGLASLVREFPRAENQARRALVRLEAALEGKRDLRKLAATADAAALDVSYFAGCARNLGRAEPRRRARA